MSDWCGTQVLSVSQEWLLPIYFDGEETELTGYSNRSFFNVV